jgi:hypothetical protein
MIARSKRSPDAISQAIQRLLEERQEHLDAIAGIEATIEQVGSVLGRAGSKRGGRRAATEVAAVGKRGRRRRRRRRYETTGEDAILAFVRQQKNPTTRQIKQLWAGEGRGGSADNVLSKLVRDRRLKREPLKDQRGSRYLVA